jgi:predicted transcriptional regulator of viral defense system
MKYNELTAEIKTPVFSKQDLLIQGLKVYDYQFNLWAKKGYLLKIKNGLYVFAKEADKITPQEIALWLYEPSYLSMETALAWYGFIPEMVYAHTSVTAKINRTFDNAYGHFIYRHIKSELFWGYTEIKTTYGRYLMAEPEKALLDYLYLNLARIGNEDDFENIRFNIDQIRERVDENKFRRYLKAFGVKKMYKWGLRCLA